MRTACRCSRPSSPSTSSFEMARASSSVLPFAISVRTDEHAMHMAHPLPWNLMSDTRPPPSFRSMSMLSPHSGFESWYVTSGSSIFPKLSGLRE